MTPSHRQVLVSEASQVAAARFAAKDAAEAAGFGESDNYRAGLVATELASNLVKHASGGEVLVRCVARAPWAEMEIIAIDRGPGIGDVAGSLVDGYSTSGTSGTGLGAARRLSDEFDMHSQKGRGTVVLARLRADRWAESRNRRMVVGGVSVPMRGETVCGDAWQASHHSDGVLIALLDGLGHGLQADQASAAGISSIDPRRGGDLAAHLQVMHEGMRHTRGAAAALADIRPDTHVMKYAGIGNIAGSICGTALRHAVSLNGTLGHEARQFREYAYPWEALAVMIMHSDGLGTHWSLDQPSGLRRHHPAVIAATLYRDFSRQRDDVTVVVGKEAA